MVNGVSWGSTDALGSSSPPSNATNETAFEQSIQDFLSGSGSQASGQQGGNSAAIEQDLVKVLQTLVSLLEGNSGSSGSPSSSGQAADATPTGGGSTGASPASASPTGASSASSSPTGADSDGADPASTSPASADPISASPASASPAGTGSAAADPTAAASPASTATASALGNPSDPQSLIDPNFNDGAAPKPLNQGGQNEQGPAMGAIGPEDPTTHEALDGPLKGIKYGAELTAAANANGLSPYLLAGDAAVESGDNVDGKLGGTNASNGGLLQVNPGVWNSSSNVAQSADMGARIIRMYIDQAGGNVAKGLDGYNTGDVNQSGYADGYSSYAAGVLAGANNAFKAEQAGDAASLNNSNA